MTYKDQASSAFWFWSLKIQKLWYVNLKIFNYFKILFYFKRSRANDGSVVSLSPTHLAGNNILSSVSLSGSEWLLAAFYMSQSQLHQLQILMPCQPIPKHWVLIPDTWNFLIYVRSSCSFSVWCHRSLVSWEIKK